MKGKTRVEIEDRQKESLTNPALYFERERKTEKLNSRPALQKLQGPGLHVEMWGRERHSHI